MSKARVYARNLAVNWIGYGAGMIVLLFLSPLVIHTLGTVQYGIWGLLNVLTGYMGMLDLGVRASVGRHVCLYLGKEDHDAVNETIRAGLGVFSLIGVVMLGAGMVLGQAFPLLFRDVPAQYHRSVSLLLPLMAANMWLTAVRVVFSSVLKAHDRFDVACGVDLGMLAFRAVGTVAVLRWGYGLWGLALVAVVCNLLGLVGNWMLARVIYPRLRALPLLFTRRRLRELFGYGFFAFLSAVTGKIIGQTDLIVIGVAISTSSVTTYSVGAMLIYYSAGLMGIIGSTFFPPVQRAVARGEIGSARWLFMRQVRLAMILGLLAYVGFIIFAKPFIRLWMFEPGKFAMDAVNQAALVMGVLAGSKLLTLPMIGAGELLAAMGHVRAKAAIGMAEAAANLSLSLLFVLVLEWGLVGVAAGTLVARLLVSTLVLPWYACKIASIPVRSFLLRAVAPGVLAGGAFAGICLLVRYLIVADSWTMFAVQVGLAIAGYVPIAAVVLVPEDDRRRLLSRLAPRLGGSR